MPWPPRITRRSIRMCPSTGVDYLRSSKLLAENALEAYHTGIVHRETLGQQQSVAIAAEGNWTGLLVEDETSVGTLPGAENPFNVDCFMGWEGHYRPGTWTPLEVGITSTLTENFDGQRHMVTEGLFKYVAIDAKGRPRPLPDAPVTPSDNLAV